MSVCYNSLHVNGIDGNSKLRLRIKGVHPRDGNGVDDGVTFTALLSKAKIRSSGDVNRDLKALKRVLKRGLQSIKDRFESGSFDDQSDDQLLVDIRALMSLHKDFYRYFKTQRIDHQSPLGWSRPHRCSYNSDGYLDDVRGRLSSRRDTSWSSWVKDSAKWLAKAGSLLSSCSEVEFFNDNFLGEFSDKSVFSKAIVCQPVLSTCSVSDFDSASSNMGETDGSLISATPSENEDEVSVSRALPPDYGFSCLDREPAFRSGFYPVSAAGTSQFGHLGSFESLESVNDVTSGDSDSFGSGETEGSSISSTSSGGEFEVEPVSVSSGAQTHNCNLSNLGSAPFPPLVPLNHLSYRGEGALDSTREKKMADDHYRRKQLTNALLTWKANKKQMSIIQIKQTLSRRYFSLWRTYIQNKNRLALEKSESQRREINRLQAIAEKERIQKLKDKQLELERIANRKILISKLGPLPGPVYSENDIPIEEVDVEQPLLKLKTLQKRLSLTVDITNDLLSCLYTPLEDDLLPIIAKLKDRSHSVNNDRYTQFISLLESPCDKMDAFQGFQVYLESDVNSLDVLLQELKGLAQDTMAALPEKVSYLRQVSTHFLSLVSFFKDLQRFVHSKTVRVRDIEDDDVVYCNPPSYETLVHQLNELRSNLKLLEMSHPDLFTQASETLDGYKSMPIFVSSKQAWDVTADLCDPNKEKKVFDKRCFSIRERLTDLNTTLTILDLDTPSIQFDEVNDVEPNSMMSVDLESEVVKTYREALTRIEASIPFCFTGNLDDDETLTQCEQSLERIKRDIEAGSKEPLYHAMPQLSWVDHQVIMAQSPSLRPVVLDVLSITEGSVDKLLSEGYSSDSEYSLDSKRMNRDIEALCLEE